MNDTVMKPDVKHSTLQKEVVLTKLLLNVPSPEMIAPERNHS